MGGPQAGGQALREVRRGVAEAGDAQVLQVLRMVDALEVRGATDAVLAPVRSRLRAMQPARPLRFARLLFMPADPLIVPPVGWRPGGPYLPRHALLVLAEAVRGILAGPDATVESKAALTRVDALIKDRNTADLTIVRRAGGLLWPLAAHALRRLGSPADASVGTACADSWRREGLPEGEMQPMALALSGVMAFALPLHDAGRSGAAPSAAILGEALSAAEALGRRAGSMLLSLWLIRAPQAASVLLEAPQGNAAPPRHVAEAAADAAMAWLEAETGAAPSVITATAAGEINRQADLLEALGSQSTDAALRRRVMQAKTALLDQSIHRFEASLHEAINGGLAQLPPAGPKRGAALDAMEAAARLLHAFELEARRLGGGPKFTALASAAEASLRAAPDLTLMDRVRLTELLSGPEAALRLLRSQ